MNRPAPVSPSRPAPLVRRTLGVDGHFQRMRLSESEAWRCLDACVADVAWAVSRLKETAAHELATAADLSSARAKYAEKGHELAVVVRRGVTEARTWRAPAELAAYDAALAAWDASGRSAGEDAAALRAALRNAIQGLSRWAASVGR